MANEIATINLEDYDVYCLEQVKHNGHGPACTFISANEISKAKQPLSDMTLAVAYSNINMPLINTIECARASISPNWVRVRFNNKAFTPQYVSINKIDLGSKTTRRDTILSHIKSYFHYYGKEHPLYGKEIAIIRF